MSILHLTLCSALVAMASAAAGPECWYTDPPAVCNHNVEDTQLDIDTGTYGDFDAQMTWCQGECAKDVDAQLPDCKHFTVRPMRGQPKCFLMLTCDKNTEDTCLDEGICGGGLGDCEDQTGCEPLPPFDAANDDKIRWICDHVDNPYDATGEIPVGSACTLSCDGWIDDNGDTVNVLSTCKVDLLWSDSVVRTPGWLEADGVISTDTVPALKGKTLPLPSATPAEQITCGCGPKPMAWTNTDTEVVVNYDPNALPGTTFICENGEYIQNNSGQSAFIIAEDMTCRLYCDGYHVATMECLNGDWTGEPELGAWCYYEPTVDDEMGVYVPPTL